MADLLQSARDLGPSLADRSELIEATRTLPDDVVHDLRAAGLFRLLTPASLGGPELDVNTAIDDGELGAADAEVVRTAFEGFDQVLGVIALRRAEDASPDVPVDEIERLIGERKAARARRDFAAADAIRDDLVARGIILEDTPAGTRWNRK